MEKTFRQELGGWASFQSAGTDLMPPDDSSNKPPSSPAGIAGGTWQPPAPEVLQEYFPQYEIVALLGRGGMGAVYKGWQRSLDRFVAIKILPPGMDDAEGNYTERFKQEAKSMAKLMHPGIVAVFDAGETPSGLLYFVMEFVEGTDVSHMVQSQGKLPPEHALAITAHVCDALHYAHTHGIVHRDIKPANIMVNMEGAVKVADFGLAKHSDPALGGLTKTNMAIGTPDFVAPEALIPGANLDGRADLYAVGVMLDQMLTGNIPRGMFTMPSVMIREVDPRFDAIVAKAMKYDREERYQSASEFRRALDVILTTPMVKAVDEAPELPQNPPAPDSAEEAPAAPRSSKIPPAKPRKPQSILVMSTVASVVIIVALAAAVATKKNNDTADQPILLAQANTPPKSGPGPEAAALAPDVLKRLAELRSAYDQYANTNILKPHEAAVATLEANYLKALERARDDATKKGDLDTVVAAKAEMDRLGKKEALPPTDDALPAAFKPLRVTFRTELTKLEQARDAKIPDANKRYDTALDAYQVQLTQSQQVDAALHVKGLRAELAASKGILPGASSPPSSVAAAPPPPHAGGVPTSAKNQQIEQWLVGSTWKIGEAFFYFARNGKGALKNVDVIRKFSKPWEMQHDGTVLLMPPGGGHKIFSFESADSGSVRSYSPKNTEPKPQELIKVPNDPELVKAAGDSPGQPAGTAQDDSSIPPVGAPVSADKLKEIEGWLVGNTWRSGKEPASVFYFASNGRGVMKDPTNGITRFAGNKVPGWEIRQDGSILAITHGMNKLITLGGPESGTITSYDSNKAKMVGRPLKLTKVANDPEMVKAVK